MSIDSGEGRCPKLVLERSVADSRGRAISEGCNDGAKIQWKSDFLKGPSKKKKKKKEEH